MGPSAKHWFGTDDLGRDQLTEIMYAGRISLTIGLVVALLSTVVGVAVGAVSAVLRRCDGSGVERRSPTCFSSSPTSRCSRSRW